MQQERILSATVIFLLCYRATSTLVPTGRCPLTDNGSFYCAPCVESPCNHNYTEHKNYLERTCPGGAVPEPCACCYMCGKLEGEMCGGPHGCDGRCGHNLLCSVPEKDFLDNSTAATGICVGKSKAIRVRAYLYSCTCVLFTVPNVIVT